jgi:hypothetical protein
LGEANSSKLVVLAAHFSWRPPRIIGIIEDSVHPGAQDPDAPSGPDAWIMEIWNYLKDNILPDEHVSAECIVHVSKRYTPVEGDLYRRGTNGILMWCITGEDECELFIEVHGGKRGNHASCHTLVIKAFRHGFCWPIALQEAIELVKRCKTCQFHAK